MFVKAQNGKRFINLANVTDIYSERKTEGGKQKYVLYFDKIPGGSFSKQESIDRVLILLENRVQEKRSAEIIDSEAVAKDEVAIGKTVVVQEVNTTDQDVYHIVGAAGADIFSGRISNESPIAQALIGKKTGDIVTIESPAGSYDVEILSLEKTA